MNIVITGASRGIGKAIAAKFISAGWNAAICSLNADRINEAKEKLSALNPQTFILAEAFNAGNKSDVLAFAQKIKDNFDKVDVLINNAGIFVPGSIYEEKEDVLENTMAVNVYGAYHLTKALLPEMIRRQSGHIFNICSTASLRAYPNGGSYSISKFALLGFSKNLREEMKPFGIKVTAVCPGPTLTDSWSGFEGLENRMMRPEDIADVIWASYHLSSQTVTEDIILRPILGDI
jgi:NAD(P)-dependent dehydrogenase (short-subunit alcohol dehydrogenase family)